MTDGYVRLYDEMLKTSRTKRPILVPGGVWDVEEISRMLQAGNVWYIGRKAAGQRLGRTLTTMLSRSGLGE